MRAETEMSAGRPQPEHRSRLRQAVPWVVVAFWVALMAVVGPFAGSLADVQRDRAVDYLPHGRGLHPGREDPGHAARR